MQILVTTYICLLKKILNLTIERKQTHSLTSCIYMNFSPIHASNITQITTLYTLDNQNLRRTQKLLAQNMAHTIKGNGKQATRLSARVGVIIECLPWLLQHTFFMFVLMSSSFELHFHAHCTPVAGSAGKQTNTRVYFSTFVCRSQLL